VGERWIKIYKGKEGTDAKPRPTLKKSNCIDLGVGKGKRGKRRKIYLFLKAHSATNQGVS